MLKVKYSGLRIAKLSASAVDMGVDILLSDIGIITGWEVPSHVIYKTRLINEIIAWLKDVADDFTFAEIKYALRKYSGEVKDYGKPVNLSLLNNIIKMYRADREELSSREEFINPPAQRIYTDEENEDLSRRDAQVAYAYFLGGIELDTIESNRFILLKDGLLKEGETVLEMFIRRADRGIHALYEFVKSENK